MEQIYNYINNKNDVYVKLIEIELAKLEIESLRLQIELHKLQDNVTALTPAQVEDITKNAVGCTAKSTEECTTEYTSTNFRDALPPDVIIGVANAWIKRNPPVRGMKCVDYYHKYTQEVNSNYHVSDVELEYLASQPYEMPIWYSKIDNIWYRMW